MRIFFLLIFFCVTFEISAQVFETTVDVGFNLSQVSIIPTADGGYIVGGGLNNSNIGPEQVVKLDSAGNVVWARKYNNGFFDFAPLGANHFIIYDTRDSSGWGQHQYGEISIFNSEGIFQSAITIPETLQVKKVHPTSDGGTIAVGSAPPPNGNGQSMILKTDSSLNFQWIKYIDDTLSYRTPLSDIIEAGSGGYITVGTYQYPDTFAAPDHQLIARLNGTGDTLWTKSINTICGSRIYNSNEGGFLIVGQSCDSFPSITSLDSSGNVKWAIAFPCSPWFYIDDFVMSADSQFVFAATKHNNGISSPCLLKTDTSGTVLWQHQYPAPDNISYRNAVVKAEDGGFALLVINGYTIFTLVKTDSSGMSYCDSLNASPLREDLLLQSTPPFLSIHPIFNTGQPYTSTQFPNLADSSFIQLDNCLIAGSDRILTDKNSFIIFPNPATKQFAISSLQIINGELEIFNLLGEKIYSAEFSRQSTVDCRQLGRGIYFVRVTNNEFQATKKLIVQ